MFDDLKQQAATDQKFAAFTHWANELFEYRKRLIEAGFPVREAFDLTREYHNVTIAAATASKQRGNTG
jgi:hypothetical protein